MHDRDGEKMLMLADAWCRALGIDPGLYPNLPDLSGQPAGIRLPQAVAATLAAVDPTPRPDTLPADPPPPSGTPGAGGPTPAAPPTCRPA